MEFWRENFPGDEIYRPGRGLTVMTRGKIIKRSFHRFGYNGCGALARIELGGKHFSVIAVDVASNPLVSRKQTLKRIFNLARKKRNQPAIILGDFNTPSDSVWFEPVRRDFAHAFESAGHGYFSTWPAPFPFLAIDHVWLARPFEARSARLQRTFCSDHFQFIVEVSLG